MQVHIVRDPLAGHQLQKSGIPVISQLPRQSLRLYGDFCAEGHLRGILRQRHGQRLTAAHQRFHRCADLPYIQPVPSQSQRRANQTQHCPSPPVRRQKQRQNACAQTYQTAGQQPAVRQGVLRQKDPGGKAAAKQGQLSHFAGYGSGRSVRPSR